MKLWWVALVAAIGALAAGAALGGTRDKPETTVREANVDANGWIKTHEQGTANVNVTNLPGTQQVAGTVAVSNFPSSSHVTVDNFPAQSNHVTVDNFPAQTGHVTVDNLPSTQQVSGTVTVANPSTVPATTKTAGIPGDIAILAGQTTNSFFGQTIKVTAISIDNVNDGTLEVRLTNSADPSFSFIIWPKDGGSVSTFTSPIPADGIHAICNNSNDTCHFSYSVVGY